MKTNKNREKGVSRYSLSERIKKRNDINNDSLFANEDNDDDYNNNKSNNSLKKLKPIDLLTQQFREIFQQNELNWSINQMNRYLQSPDHFKMMYYIRMKARNCVNGVFGFFRKELMNKNIIKNNLLYGNSSFKANRFFSIIIIGSLGIYMINSMLKRKKPKKMGWLFNRQMRSNENPIKQLQNQNEELIKTNNELMKMIKEKYNV